MGASTVEPAELHELIAAQASTALVLLSVYQDEHDFWAGPTWSDTLDALVSTVAQSPAGGWVRGRMPIMTAARCCKNFDEYVWAVVRGWTQATLTDEQVGAAATYIASTATTCVPISTTPLRCC